MLGFLGSILGSATSGLFGMMGQNSANDTAMQMSSTAYQRSYTDMMKAGLNPAMMYNSGGGPASTPPIGNSMAAPAAAAKDAASSATAIAVAEKTIDQLTSQIAKQNADTANVKAALPGIAGDSAVRARESGAIMGIPKHPFNSVVTAGYGADKSKSLGTIGSIAGGAATSGKAVADAVKAGADALPSVPAGSAKSAFRSLKEKYHNSPSYTEAEREAARLRNAKRWGWLTGETPRGSTAYQQ